MTVPYNNGGNFNFRKELQLLLQIPFNEILFFLHHPTINKYSQLDNCNVDIDCFSNTKYVSTANSANDAGVCILSSNDTPTNHA